MAAHQATEQIIEIRAGVGDPPSMRAVPGTQLGPISVGHRAAWKVVAVGVRDEHAFIYFDGETVFVQSVDPANPAFVNGAPVSKEWMPVPVGSEIAFGEARLSVAIEGSSSVSKSNRPFAPGEFVNEDSVVPVRTRNVTPAAALQTGPPDPRPFDPGEFSSSDPEMTKLGPVEEIAKAVRPMPQPGPPRGGTVQMVAIPPGMAPNPAIPPAATSSNPYGDMGQMGDPNMLPAYTPMGGVPMAGPYGVPQPAPSGPGGVTQGQTAPGGKLGPLLEKVKTTWQAAPPPRKAIFVLTPLVLVSVFVLFSGQSPPPPAPPRPTATTQQPTATPTPAGTPAPTVGPIETATPTPIASSTAPVPLGATATTPTAGQTAITPPIASTSPPPVIPQRGAPPPKKSLERAAADAVAAGAFLEAAALYEQLARENPGNPSFAEAARILRNKGKPVAQ